MRDHLDQRHPTAPAPGFVATGSNVTVTIGRNIGDLPMAPPDWDRFQDDVRDQLGALLKADYTFTYYGEGEWEGVKEESAVILLVGTTYTARTGDVDSVLSALSDKYLQDAIGWSAGLGHLATR